MSLYKIVLLNICFLMITKFNHLASEPIGLRCEFNGTIDFTLKLNTVNFIKKNTPPLKYDDQLSLDNIKSGEFTNGNLCCRYALPSNKWVFLDDAICIRISLKPNSHVHVFDHKDVYFFNIFKKPLYFKLGRHCFEGLKNNFYIKTHDGSSLSLTQLDSKLSPDDNNYYFTLSPGHALIYPVNSEVTITLSTS